MKNLRNILRWSTALNVNALAGLYPPQLEKRIIAYLAIGALAACSNETGVLERATAHKRLNCRQRFSVCCFFFFDKMSGSDYCDSEKIILEVEKRPAVYNKQLPEYSDKNIKEELWVEVCEAVVPEW
ncbi:hypothetical protein JTB14_025315 [Gonioctena quinquepunctata]|nr:hypothetical protein JTB14_025315 [Gonioctena quinquepunctata]